MIKLKTSKKSSQSDSRVYERIPERQKIVWKINDQHLKGEGRVRNISAHGMLLETDRVLTPEDDFIFSFDSDLGQNNYIPQNGRLVWKRNTGVASKRSLCGIEFVNPTPFVATNLRKRILLRVQKAYQKKYHNLASAVVAILMLALTGYVIWVGASIHRDTVKVNEGLIQSSNTQALLVQNYGDLYVESQIKIAQLEEQILSIQSLYDDSQQILEEASKELAATKSLLQETETRLAESKFQNSQLKNEVAQLNATTEEGVVETKAQLLETINGLKERNSGLNSQILELEEQLAFYQIDINSLQEGKEIKSFYHEKLKELRNKIREFQAKALEIKISASKEKDRIRLILGNNGYLTKDGQAVQVDEEKYNAAEPVSSNETGKSNIKIDVQFVN